MKITIAGAGGRMGQMLVRQIDHAGLRRVSCQRGHRRHVFPAAAEREQLAVAGGDHGFFHAGRLHDGAHVELHGHDLLAGREGDDRRLPIAAGKDCAVAQRIRPRRRGQGQEGAGIALHLIL